ncbi:MAG TPA: amidohydrolase [bacterium]|nr:amidohydrolase [bacterium]
MRQILRGGTVVTMNSRSEILARGTVVIDGARIIEVREECAAGPASPAPRGGAGVPAEPGDVVIDCSDHVVMPGLINTHTHAGFALFRGLAEDRSRDAWFASAYGPPYMDRAVPEDYYWGTMLGGLEMLLSGTTCTADRFSHMAVIAEAFDRLGMRAVVCHTLRDITAPLEWDRATALIDRWGVAGGSRIRCGIGPHAPDTCSDDLLRRIRGTARETGAHVFIHCSQARAELEALRTRGHAGGVHCLASTGLLGPDVVAAHCIYIDEDEIRLLADSGTWVSHCPVSAARIEGHLAPVPALLRAGAHVALGTDWAVTNNGMDLFDEMKCAGVLNKVTAGDTSVLPSAALLRMATIDAARALGLDGEVGSLEPGKRADIIALDMRSPHLQPLHDVAATLVYSAKGLDVRHVWVDGRWLIRDRRPTDLNVDDVYANVERIWQRFRRSGA